MFISIASPSRTTGRVRKIPAVGHSVNWNVNGVFVSPTTVRADPSLAVPMVVCPLSRGLMRNPRRSATPAEMAVRHSLPESTSAVHEWPFLKETRAYRP